VLVQGVGRTYDSLVQHCYFLYIAVHFETQWGNHIAAWLKFVGCNEPHGEQFQFKKSLITVVASSQGLLQGGKAGRGVAWQTWRNLIVWLSKSNSPRRQGRGLGAEIYWPRLTSTLEYTLMLHLQDLIPQGSPLAHYFVFSWSCCYPNQPPSSPRTGPMPSLRAASKPAGMAPDPRRPPCSIPH
jgi:hypothetical protein